MWTGVLPYTEPGFKQLTFMVDGVKIINPLAPTISSGCCSVD